MMNYNNKIIRRTTMINYKNIIRFELNQVRDERIRKAKEQYHGYVKSKKEDYKVLEEGFWKEVTEEDMCQYFD